MANVKQPLAKFPAEIRQVSSKKTASLDMVYRVVLESSDQSILMLGAIDADMLVDITVEVQS
jgi:hypothetical protein